MNSSNSRRDFLKTGGAALAAVGALGASALAAPTHAAGGKNAADKPTSGRQVPGDGTYPTIELAKPSFLLGIVQARVRAVDSSNSRKSLRDNLNHMLRLIDKAFRIGPKPDWLHFHEFAITGWDTWTRDEILKFALEVPGPETEEISKKAKQYGCYITFGSYAKDADWPGHVLSLTITIGPDGSIVARDWKGAAEDVSGSFGANIQMFSTTIYSVLDRYIEMYGRDAVVPVHRTPLGNFAATQMQRAPEMYRAMAIKGAEVILATATGGFSSVDQQSSARNNRVYVAMANNAVSPDNPEFFDDTGGAGGCAIWGPDGKPVAEANGKAEQLVMARLPIAELRTRHRQPHVQSMELVRDIFNDYNLSYPPNLFSEYDPTSLEDAARYLKSKSRWK
ncbi:MAG: nitrilase-related carbon-nitrogen hydrolase [Burkholderiaceae bacterium]